MNTLDSINDMIEKIEKMFEMYDKGLTGETCVTHEDIHKAIDMMMLDLIDNKRLRELYDKTYPTYTY